MNLQNNLANFSFLSLLGSMIFYWIGVSFTNRGPSAPSFSTPLLSSPPSPQGGGQSEATLISAWPPSGPKQEKNFSYWTITFGRYGIILSNILLGLLLTLRWKESGHFPLSNLYESLMFLSWCFTVIHLVIEKMTLDSSGVGQSSMSGTASNGGSVFLTANKKNQIGKLLGAITTPSALLINAFATFTLPKEMQEASPLVPALQSNWLMMHVTVMILSYAALILGSLLSIAFLIVTSGKDLSLMNEGSSQKSEVETSPPEKTNVAFGQKDPSLMFALTLDNLSYRILGIGFPFLTIGILSGAVWANEAWGSYWSWDPKETWALLTWLIFAIYLHTRLNKGWEGKKPAIIASFGFVVVWVCYLGVNLIGEGLHSYGWIAQGA